MGTSAVDAVDAIDMVSGGIARWAAGRNLAPAALSGFSLGFAVIAAIWLAGGTAPAETVALAAVAASFFSFRAARFYAGTTPALDWALGACALIAEFAVYAGIATGASRAPGPLGDLLRGTALDTIGGPGAAGVWWLAIAAAMLLAVREMANICLAAAKSRTAEAAGPDAARRVLLPAPTSGIRLVVLVLVVMVAGARPTLVLALAGGALVLVARAFIPGPNSGIIGYRGDGPLAVWIGQWVDGRLPPLPPLLTGLLVTGVLTAFGVGHLPGVLVFTPAEAMLLAALGCWHRHDGARDWLVPALLHTGEYVFIAALGAAGNVPPPVTFAVITGVALRHFDLAYRARNHVSPGLFMRPGATVGQEPALPGADWRALGWEGRMIVAALAAAIGITPYAYLAFALYLWALLGREAIVGWSASRSG